MKDKLSAEYRRGVCKFLHSHLTGSNVIHAINSCAIPILRYSAGIVSWTVEELRQLDHGTRKLLSLHGAFTVPVMWIVYTSLATWVTEDWFLFFIVSRQSEEHASERYIGSTDEPLLRMVASQNWFPAESDSGK